MYSIYTSYALFIAGCGVAGLAALKTALEDGHDAIGFERKPDIGGIWNWQVSVYGNG